MDLVEILLEACENGKLEKVKSLVKQGVNIYEDDDYALQLASEAGHPDIIDYIITNHDNKKSINNVLFWAAEAGNLEMVKHIIQKGADIYAENDYTLKRVVCNDFPHLTKYLFSLYENKEKAFKIILDNLIDKSDLSMVKEILDNHVLKLEKEFLEKIKENHSVIYDYIKTIEEIRLVKSEIHI